MNTTEKLNYLKTIYHNIILDDKVYTHTYMSGASDKVDSYQPSLKLKSKIQFILELLANHSNIDNVWSDIEASFTIYVNVSDKEVILFYLQKPTEGITIKR